MFRHEEKAFAADMVLSSNINSVLIVSFRSDSCRCRLCSSYPQKLLVPVWITDKELESVASFRSGKRIPVVVYR